MLTSSSFRSIQNIVPAIAVLQTINSHTRTLSAHLIEADNWTALLANHIQRRLSDIIEVSDALQPFDKGLVEARLTLPSDFAQQLLNTADHLNRLFKFEGDLKIRGKMLLKPSSF